MIILLQIRPSNILVSGRSGSGKTEIFRVLSRLMNAPFIRVEATRYTEVGFHGDDVTNIIVDLYKKSKFLLLSYFSTFWLRNYNYNLKDEEIASK